MQISREPKPNVMHDCNESKNNNVKGPAVLIRTIGKVLPVKTTITSPGDWITFAFKPMAIPLTSLNQHDVIRTTIF